MKNILQFMLFCFLGITVSVYAKDNLLVNKQHFKYGKAPQILEKQETSLSDIRSTQTAPLQTNSILIDSSRNGYGFSNSGPKSLDISMDASGNLWAGMSYRKFVPGDVGSGILGVAEFNINAGFDYNNFIFWDYVNNMANFGFGARFPGFLATPEGPLPVWNQFISQNPDESTVSDGFLSFDAFGWGVTGGGFSSPESWSQGSNTNIIHSLWLGTTDIYKDPSGTYHVGGVWEIDLNSGNYTFIHGQSTDLTTWTWDNAVVNWPVTTFPEMNNPRFAWGSDGFGVWITTGYKTDSGEEDFKVMVATTENYGTSWSAVTRYEWDDLGIPSQIFQSDSIYIIDLAGDTVLYEGPASVGISYNFDLIVLPGNDIHIGCSLAWGAEGSEVDTYYPNPMYMGLKDIYSTDKGLSWNQSTIFWQRGQLFADDSTSENGIETLNEIDLGYDEEGNIYAAWLDRDPVQVVQAKYPRFDERQTEDNLDVWASMSRDGGKSWSETPLRITNDPQTPKAGLRLATRTKWFEQDMGKTYILYQVPDYDRPLPPPVSIQGDHVVWYYVAEAKGFPDAPVIIEPLSEQIPEKFNLFQNYPNPFNPITSIRFNIISSSDVSLKVYNALGKEVATLINKPLVAGSYEVSWNADNLASGIYLYKIQTNDFRAVKKMLLVK